MFKKVFFTNEILEFKINGKWIMGSLKDIDKENNKFILSLEKEDKNKLSFEQQNSLLLINNFNLKAALIWSDKYSENQKIEFYDDVESGWTEGTIKAIKNDFYIVSYSNKYLYNHRKILYKNTIEKWIILFI